jgi:hypothetical protein
LKIWEDGETRKTARFQDEWDRRREQSEVGFPNLSLHQKLPEALLNSKLQLGLWLIPVISASQEREVEGSKPQDSLGKSTSPYLKNKLIKKGRECGSSCRAPD